MLQLGRAPRPARCRADRDLGPALLAPLVQAFQWPDIANVFTVDSVVTVVDGPAAAAGQFAENLGGGRRAAPRRPQPRPRMPPLHELFEDQLSAADLVVLNKADLLDEARARAASRRWCARSCRPRSRS